MNIQFGEFEPVGSVRGKLVSGGRLQIPVKIRQSLGLEDGDTVMMVLKDGYLQVKAFRDVLRDVRAQFQSHAPAKNGSIVDDFIAERRLAAESE